MASVFDTAKYILERTGRISAWKLQKLCYYSQAWALAWTEKPLFNDDFEAWENGPVCPTLFHAYKGKFYVEAADFPNGNSEDLSEDEKETVDVILNDYGSFEPYYLREMIHTEKPWLEARDKSSESDSGGSVITKEAMGDYYGSL